MSRRPTQSIAERDALIARVSAPAHVAKLRAGRCRTLATESFNTARSLMAAARLWRKQGQPELARYTVAKAREAHKVAMRHQQLAHDFTTQLPHTERVAP